VIQVLLAAAQAMLLAGIQMPSQLPPVRGLQKRQALPAHQQSLIVAVMVLLQVVSQNSAILEVLSHLCQTVKEMLEGQEVVVKAHCQALAK
jgi:hypothetical protein